MVQEKKKKILDLPKETVERLKEGGKELEIAEEQIKLMKKIGMDTRVLEDKLQWARETRQAILEASTE